MRWRLRLLGGVLRCLILPRVLPGSRLLEVLDALGAAAIEGWNWLALLAAFSLVYAVVGVLA